MYGYMYMYIRTKMLKNFFLKYMYFKVYSVKHSLSFIVNIIYMYELVLVSQSKVKVSKTNKKLM